MMHARITKRLPILIVFLFSIGVYAGGRIGGNGGNPIALEFQSDGDSAIQSVLRDARAYPQLPRGTDLKGLLNSANIIVVDTPLYVVFNGIQQESAAVNTTNPNTILVNSTMWNGIQNVSLKKALALHEVLGLAGLEGTGDYRISQIYYDKVGSLLPDCHKGCGTAVPSPDNSDSFSISLAQKEFLSGSLSNPDQITGSWFPIGVADYQNIPKCELGLGSEGFDVNGLEGSAEFIFSSPAQERLVNINGQSFSGVFEKVTVTKSGSGTLFFSTPSDAGLFYGDHSKVNFACRLLQGTDNRLICQGTFSYDPLAGRGDASSWNDKVIFYVELKKN